MEILDPGYLPGYPGIEVISRDITISRDDNQANIELKKIASKNKIWKRRVG